MNNQKKNSAVIYCEKNLGTMDGKTANGLIRYSEKYKIIAVIDSSKAGQDAGVVVCGKNNGIPVYKDLSQTLKSDLSPQYFIYGMAPRDGKFSPGDRHILFSAMEKGMNIVNGLHEFLGDDKEFVAKSRSCYVTIQDIRKPKTAKELTLFTGQIFNVKCPKIAILGTDTSIGKRTTATILTEALQNRGVNAVMIATGQTGLIQGREYGVVLDAIPEQFIAGELESAIVKAYEKENPDIIIIEGQGALSHPAYCASCFIVRGGAPDAIILQHAPERKMLGDYPNLPMPTVTSEIEMIESFSGSKVIGLALNHENMTKELMETTIEDYEERYELPVTDVLIKGADKLIDGIVASFPELKEKILGA